MYFARTILALLVVGVIGLVGYQIGISQAVATQVPATAGAVPVAYWYGPGHWLSFGFLGFLFPLFFLFLLFGLMRAAFGGHRSWSDGGYRGGGWMSGRDRIEQIHRELHGEKPASGPSGTQT
jgi:hypothetical protein